MNSIDLYHFLLISNVKYKISKSFRLWSKRHIPEGPVSEVWLERNYTINPSFDERAEQSSIHDQFSSYT